MVKLEPYLARDRRVFNGALCSDMQREITHRTRLSEVMQELDNTASCTYFPMEGKFLVFVNSNMLENPNLEGPPIELTGNFHSCKQEALIEAINTLQE